jgi:hypothetical protein
LTFLAACVPFSLTASLSVALLRVMENHPDHVWQLGATRHEADDGVKMTAWHGVRSSLESAQIARIGSDFQSSKLAFVSTMVRELRGENNDKIVIFSNSIPTIGYACSSPSL